MSASFERRKCFRQEIFEPRVIQYSLGAFDSETFEGLVLNVSETGACLLISNYFDIWQEITLKDFDVYGSYKTGTVQWIEKADKTLYKVGLIF